MAAPNATQPIHPDRLYDYRTAARELNISARLFREDWIDTDKIDVVPARSTFWVMGHSIIAAVEEGMGRRSLVKPKRQ